MDELEPWEEIGWEGYAERRDEATWERMRAEYPPQLDHSKPVAPYRPKRPYKRRPRPHRFHLQVTCSCGMVFYDAAKNRVLYRVGMHRNRCDGELTPELVPAPGVGRKPRK